MIDIHAHILPGIDDGAKTPEDSLKMLSMAKKQQVSLVVATPHCYLHHSESVQHFIERRANRCQALRQAIASSGEELPDVRLGAEVYLDNDLNRYPDIHDLCFEGTDYLLMEFPMKTIDVHTYDWIYSLTLKGIKPIIAHVDRYPEREAVFSNLAGLDVIYQINASLFSTPFSGKIIKSVFSQQDAFYIAASDMHNTTLRKCTLADAYRAAKNKYPGKADMLFDANMKVLEDSLTAGAVNA